MLLRIKMNFNIITKFLFILFLALLTKTVPIEEYPNEITRNGNTYIDGKPGKDTFVYRYDLSKNIPDVDYCKSVTYGKFVSKNSRFFLNGNDYLCLAPYIGSIPKDIKELNGKHLIIIDEYFYDLSPNMRHTFKKCDIDKIDKDSIDKCYEEFAEIIGVDVETIKPKLDFKESIDLMLQFLKDSCEKEEGKFFFNNDDYLCLVKPDSVPHRDDLLNDNIIIYHDAFYTPHDVLTHITTGDFYEYYSKIAKLLNVNIDSLTPSKSFELAVKEFFLIINKGNSCEYYEKGNNFVCISKIYSFYDLYNKDIDSLLEENVIIKNETLYRIYDCSFGCAILGISYIPRFHYLPGSYSYEEGNLSCYNRIANVMDVDVNSIILKEDTVSIIKNKEGCDSDYDMFYYISIDNGYDYVCLHEYQEQEEADIPENSVCFLDNNVIINCVNEQHTKIEACKKENEIFDYDSCRETIEHIVLNKSFYEYPSNGQPINVTTSETQSIMTTSKTISYSYQPSTEQLSSPSTLSISTISTSISNQLPSQSLSSSTSSSKSIPSPTIIEFEPEASLCNGVDPAPYYIFIEGNGESIDKQALLEILNDRMNEIYNLIFKNVIKYRSFCNVALDEELSTIYPEGTKFLFVDELKQSNTTAYDNFVPLKSYLLKIGNYLTSEEDGCSASASASGGCHTFYAYLSEDMVEEIKNLPNIVKMKESYVYSTYFPLYFNRHFDYMSAPKYIVDPPFYNHPKSLPKILPEIVSIEEAESISTTEIIIPTTEQIPEMMSINEIPVTTNTMEILVTTNTKEIPMTTSKCLPSTVIVTIKETVTIKDTKTITVTV